MEATNVAQKPSLSIAEAAQYIGIGRASLYRLLGGGDINSFHIGRRHLILRAELDRFIQRLIEA